ncbi:hypothetical protein OSG_eHP14_00075 [environmental Halophage eHP-14]|nr:hypothetical protein OSG_eHP14_00075 [environmental Halophage eHP-14]
MRTRQEERMPDPDMVVGEPETYPEVVRWIRLAIGVEPDGRDHLSIQEHKQVLEKIAPEKAPPIVACNPKVGPGLEGMHERVADAAGCQPPDAKAFTYDGLSAIKAALEEVDDDD